MDEFVIDGMHVQVLTNQRETALQKYRKVDNHLILGMLGQVKRGDMKDAEKIKALLEVATERGLVKVG